MDSSKHKFSMLYVSKIEITHLNLKSQCVHYYQHKKL